MVVVAPTSSPLMTGATGRVKEGQLVRATCHSAPALPAPAIKFYINDKPVVSEFMSRPKQTTRNNRVLVSRGVSFKAFRQLFNNGHLVLQCRVRLLDMEWSTSTELILEDHLLTHGGAQGNTTYCRRKRLLVFITVSVLVSLGVIVLIC